MKNKLIGLLAAVALLSVVTAGIGKASAYFTTYAQARGGHVIELGDETTIHEEFDGKDKKVTLTNSADSKQAVWVRAKGIAGAEHELSYSQNGSAWVPDEDGFYIYQSPLLPGESTDPALIVGVNSEKVENGSSIDVVVVYETTPAVQNDVGTYEAPDWDADGWTRRTEQV